MPTNRTALASLLDAIHAGLSQQDKHTELLERWHTPAVIYQARELLRADGIYLAPESRARFTRQRQVTAHRRATTI